MSCVFFCGCGEHQFEAIIIVGGRNFKKCSTVCTRLSFFEGGFTLLRFITNSARLRRAPSFAMHNMFLSAGV